MLRGGVCGVSTRMFMMAVLLLLVLVGSGCTQGNPLEGKWTADNGEGYFEFFDDGTVHHVRTGAPMFAVDETFEYELVGDGQVRITSVDGDTKYFDYVIENDVLRFALQDIQNSWGTHTGVTFDDSVLESQHERIE